MPLYDVKCHKCGKVEEIFRSMSEYDQLPECCGQKTEKQLTAHTALPDIQPYQSMIDGSWIGSRSKHKAHLKQHRCIEVGNETKYLKPHKPKDDPRLKEAIIRAANERLRS